MAKAGFCMQCQSNVWLTEQGCCPQGHAAALISNVYDAPAPPPVSQPGGGELNQEYPGQQVVVTDVKMPFGSMVRFMVKWSLASIPAVIILIFVGAMFWGLFAGIVAGLVAR